MAETNPFDHPIFEHNAFDLVGRLLDHIGDAPVRPEDFGGYHFKEEKPLGIGAMGLVWLAEEKVSGRTVAIKFLNNTVDPQAWARHEAKRLGSLKHPFIAVLHASDVRPDGKPWLAMEYVEGQRLDAYCASKPVSAHERLSLFYKVCEGVRHAHSTLVIHGDLKPSNILVTASDDPKLIDFGLAQQSQSPGLSASPSPSALGFTREYAAPELLQLNTIDARTDIYALGVILYELLAGCLPVECPREKENDEIVRLKSVRPVAPSTRISLGLGTKSENGACNLRQAEWRDLDAICIKAMEPTPEARYLAVQDLIQDLDRFRECQPLDARRPHKSSYRLGKYLRRNRIVFIAASTAVLVLASMIIFFTQRLALERDRAVAAVARTRGIQRFMAELFTAGDSLAGPSKQLTMLSVLDRAAKLGTALKSDPEAQSELYLTLGSMYDHLGRFDDAANLLGLALQTAKVAGNPELFAAAQIQMGLVHNDKGDHLEAERLVREGLTTLQRLDTGTKRSIMNDAQAALGKVLVAAGKNEQAIALLEPLITPLASSTMDEATFLENLTSLAVAHHYAGHPDQAEALNRRALERDRRNKSHPRVALDLANIATTKSTQGKFAEAESLYREAAQIEENWYGPEHPDTVLVKSFLAMTVIQAGRLAEGESLLRNVLALQERFYEKKDHEKIAFTHDTLAKLAIRQGKLDVAEEEHRTSGGMYLRLYGANDYRTAVEMANVSAVLLKKGQYIRAEETIRPVVDVLTKQSRPDDPMVPISLAVLGRALVRQKKFVEAEGPLLAAYSFFKKAPSQYRSRLNDVRTDLVQVYEGLRLTDKAKPFRNE